jgi:Tfp pilus assembly protein PilO
MSRTRQWTLGTAVVVILMLVAGWFLLISPQKSSAASINDQTQSQLAANARLQLQLAQLKAESASLPAAQAQLAAIQQHIPVSTPALPALVTTFSAAAANAGVTLTSLSPNSPTMYPANQTTNPVLWESTVAVAGTGSYYSMERFIAAIEGMQRSVLVTGFSLGPNQSTTAIGTGELAISLNLQVYFTAPPTGTTH